MIKRRKTKTIKVGQVRIGSSAPVVIQSMTKVATVDIARCVKQGYKLQTLGTLVEGGVAAITLWIISLIVL